MLSQASLSCEDCSLHRLCLPIGISAEDMERLDRIIKRKRPLARGEHLFRIGDRFRAIYAVRSGSVKTYTLTDNGSEQVTGFHLPGELVGLDAISPERHQCAARALETSSVCEIPFDRLEDLTVKIPALHHQLLRVMSQEILDEQGMLLLLGKKTAEERLAALLLSLSGRYHERGFSANEFRLSMSRNDIGNYLGLAVETVSRMFTRFQNEGILSVQRKNVRLLDVPRLKIMAGQGECGRDPAAQL
jgi:CRP/FNR family transcriptional regulator